MDIKSYTDKFNRDEGRIIAIDFDGVIHNHDKGFYDGTIYGEPISGSIESLKLLSKMGFIIKIFSCKCHPDRPLIDKKNGKELITDWLQKHAVLQYIDEVVWGKPHALIYIDDKGYRFKNWNDTIKFMENIK
tara:strand:+ start:3080 stop:3475 length:396 start_codon:yes stop_codon:yes gene_type:complete